jgi:rare lipoprotein A
MQTVPTGAGGAIPRPLFVGRQKLMGRIARAVAGTVLLLVPASSVAGDAAVASTTRVVHASWYGKEFANRPTASGERFDPYKLTCAHRTLPLGTRLRVTNLQNGRSVMVRINDRGPYVRPRELDLSYGAARALGMVSRGVTRVRIEPAES